ncbi:hypothetical protein [Azospirillum palustre]
MVGASAVVGCGGREVQRMNLSIEAAQASPLSQPVADSGVRADKGSLR